MGSITDGRPKGRSFTLCRNPCSDLHNHGVGQREAKAESGCKQSTTWGPGLPPDSTLEPAVLSSERRWCRPKDEGRCCVEGRRPGTPEPGVTAQLRSSAAISGVGQQDRPSIRQEPPVISAAGSSLQATPAENSSSMSLGSIPALDHAAVGWFHCRRYSTLGSSGDEERSEKTRPIANPLVR